MPMPGLGAADTLGLGDMLGQQAKDETDEMRKKRMLEQQQRGLMGPAATSLFGTTPVLGAVGSLLGGFSGR